MLDIQINALRILLSDEDLQQYTGDCFWNLIQTVVSSDPFTGIKAAKDIKQILFHLPTVLFWDKMKRYLLGTFSSFDDQVKMATKFNADNTQYTKFVKRLIHLINEIDDDKKIDYFASLNRSFLLTNLEENLFWKMAKFIILCTPPELDFIKSFEMSCHSENSSLLSSLYQYGLFVQHANGDGVTYILSDFAKALKQNSLNYEDGLNGEIVYNSYDSIEPLQILQPMTEEDLQSIFDSSDITIDEGNV